MLLTIVLAFATPAQANGAGTYVALGDSLAAGIGASSAHGKGYVALLNGLLSAKGGVDALSNFGEPGATSASLRGAQLTSALARINDSSDTTHVTIDIGGNDLINGACPGGWDSCQFRANFAATLDDLIGALDADPGVETLATMAYYNPAAGLGPPNETNIDADLLGANGTLSASDSGANVGLNDVILQESQSRNLPMADPYPSFHDAGQAWLSGDGVHPNDAGYAGIAAAFCVVISCDGQVIDSDPPDTTITKTPKRKGHKRRVKATFSADEPGSSFECSLDDDRFSPCSSPWRQRVSRGRHRFRVRAIDAAANVDPAPASARFRVKRKR